MGSEAQPDQAPPARGAGDVFVYATNRDMVLQVVRGDMLTQSHVGSMRSCRWYAVSALVFFSSVGELTQTTERTVRLLSPGELDDAEVAVPCDRPGALLQHDELHPAGCRENWQVWKEWGERGGV